MSENQKKIVALMTEEAAAIQVEIDNLFQAKKEACQEIDEAIKERKQALKALNSQISKLPFNLEDTEETEEAAAN